MTIIEHHSRSSDDESSDNENGGTLHSNTPGNNKSTNNNYHSQNDTLDPEMLLQQLKDVLRKLGSQIIQATNFVMTEMGGYQAFDAGARFCVRNPNIALCLAAALLVMLLPLIFIMGFTLITLLITFTGFLILEGTLSLLLIGCLGALVGSIVIFGLIGLGTYFGIIKILDIFGGLERHKATLLNYLRTEQVFETNERRRFRH